MRKSLVSELKIGCWMSWVRYYIHHSNSQTMHSSLVDYLAQVIYAKNCPTFFIAFFNWLGSLWLPHKISVCVSLAPITHFFHKGPPFWINLKFMLFLIKKGFLGAKETHPDILRGGLRNPYQLKNAIKNVGQFFAYITWAK